MDSRGYLYVVFGPHARNPLRFRKSAKPYDAGAWDARKGEDQWACLGRIVRERDPLHAELDAAVGRDLEPPREERPRDAADPVSPFEKLQQLRLRGGEGTPVMVGVPEELAALRPPEELGFRYDRVCRLCISIFHLFKAGIPFQ